MIRKKAIINEFKINNLMIGKRTNREWLHPKRFYTTVRISLTVRCHCLSQSERQHCRRFSKIRLLQPSKPGVGLHSQYAGQIDKKDDSKSPHLQYRCLLILCRTGQGSWLYQSEMARAEGPETGSGQTQAYSEKQKGNRRLYLEPVWERTPAAAIDPPYF